MDRTVFVVLLLVAAGSNPLRGQGTHLLTAETDLLKDPGGIALVHLAKGTTVATGPARDGWLPATITGWIVEAGVRVEKRDGFDLVVTATTGTPVRAQAGSGAVEGTARAGALFTRVDGRAGWVAVKRSGWIAANAIAAVPPTVARTTVPPSAKPATVSPVPPPATHAVAPPPTTTPTRPATTSIAPGTALSAQPDGAVVGTLETSLPAEVLEHRNGWAHVKVDGWVRDAAVGSVTPSQGITVADLRAAPDKYIGQTVEWSIQVLGIETADELRPELPEGQPYLLARGPLPDPGFVYVAISRDEADSLRRLGPLAKIRIRATVRAGRSRFLPTPVLNFVRRLD
jgi:hypothetical protein